MNIFIADLFQQDAVIHILQIVFVLVKRAIEQRCQPFRFGLFAVLRDKQIKGV